MRRTSTPPSIRAAACSSYDASIASKPMCASDGSFVVGPIEPATNRGRALPHKSGPVLRRELPRHLLGELSGFQVDLVYAVPQFKFSQDNSASAEGVGFNDVAAHAEKVRMNVANDVGAAQHQNFAAVFLAPVIVQGGIAFLNVGSHRAVVHDNALFHGL